MERKFWNLQIKSFQSDLTQARRSLSRAKMPDSLASFFAAVGGAGLVLIGWRLGGAMGGTAAGVFALIMAMFTLPWQEAFRARNVERATEEVEVLETELDDAVDEWVFTQSEEDTGEMDITGT